MKCLEPDLKIGVMDENFHLFKKTPDVKDLLKMIHSGTTKDLPHDLSNELQILSVSMLKLLSKEIIAA